jgi:hypothetical protein
MKDSSPGSTSKEATRRRYPGTGPFRDSPEDEARFFGRDAAGEQLYLRVLSVSLLVQFAASGRGKTSLLQAFLFPRLRLNKPFLPVIVRVDTPQEGLVDAVARSFQQACKAEGLKFPEVRKDGLWELLSTALVWRGDLLLTPVLVFDQFEEVFTLRDQAFRDTFAEELGALATGIPPERLRSKRASAPERFRARPDVKIVISLREEYLGALEEFSPAIPDLFHERLRLEPLAEDEARRAIAKPAGLVAEDGEEPFWAPRFEFEDSTLDKMIAYLKGKSGVIEPFTLQLLCGHAEAIARRKGEVGEGPGGNGEKSEGLVRLTLADFNGGEDFEQVLKNFYQQVLWKVEQKLGGSARSNAEELCEHGLLDGEGHRLSLQEGQIRHQCGVDAETLDVLRQERLIRREPRLESMSYEISHDRLAESIYESRRNKLPKTERDQRQRDREQLRKLKRISIFVSTLCVVLIGVIGLALWLYGRENLAKTEAENQKRRAEDTKQTEEVLLGFTLGDEFLGEIRDFGRTSALEKVRTLTENATGEAPQQATLVRGLAWRNAGDVERSQGHLQKSIENYGKALETIESSPDDPGRLQQKAREKARTLHRMGELKVSSGHIKEAASHYETEVGTWRDVLLLQTARPDKPEVAEDCTGLAQALASSGDVKRQMGEASLALSDLNEALDIVSGLLFGAPSSPFACRLQADEIEPYPNSRALLVLSDIAMSRARIFPGTFDEDNKTAGALAVEAVNLMPHSVPAMRKAVEALEASGLTNSDRSEGLKDLHDAAKNAEDLRRFDPESRLSQEAQANSQLTLTIRSIDCYNRKSADKSKNCESESLEDAKAMALEGRATLRALARSDPDNLDWQADLAVALELYAKMLGTAPGKEQAPDLQEAERIFTDLEREDAGDTQITWWDALFLEDKAEALADLGSPDQAKGAMEIAIGKLKALTIAHVDNAMFRYSLASSFEREAELLQRLNDARGAGMATEAEAEQKRLGDAAISSFEQSARWRADEAKSHFEVGEKSFADKNYEVALAEFQRAQLNALEYLRYASTSALVYDYLGRTYGRIADTQKKLGRPDEQAVALNRSMHATEIAAAIDPHKQEITENLLSASVRVLDARIHDKGTLKDKRYDRLVATARETVANADSLMRSERQNMVPLAVLGLSKFLLASVLQEGDEDGWDEAIQAGRIQLEKAEDGAAKDVKDKESPEVAGRARAVLADSLDESHHAEDARNERQRALKDYKLALSRYPEDIEKMEIADRNEKKHILDVIDDLNSKLGQNLHANDKGAP